MNEYNLLLNTLEKNITFKPGSDTYKFGRGLNVPSKRASYSCSLGSYGLPYVDKKEQIEYLIKGLEGEFAAFLNKSIRNEYITANNNLFLNIDGLNDIEITNQLIYFFKYNHYTSCVTNAKILSEYIHNYRAFNFSTIPYIHNNNYLDFCGSLFGIPIYVDSFLKHTDDKLYLTTDDIYYEIENAKFTLINEATFNPRILINFDYKILANNLFILNLVYKGSSMNDEWIRINREDKIDTILK